jgi:hypothetical protein
MNSPAKLPAPASRRTSSSNRLQAPKSCGIEANQATDALKRFDDDSREQLEEVRSPLARSLQAGGWSNHVLLEPADQEEIEHDAQARPRNVDHATAKRQIKNSLTELGISPSKAAKAALEYSDRRAIDSDEPLVHPASVCFSLVCPAAKAL